MSQATEIIAYARQHGGITQAEAYECAGCTRLAGRIFDLEAQGYLFDHVSIEVNSRHGKTRVTRYVLVSEPKAGRINLLLNGSDQQAAEVVDNYEILTDSRTVAVVSEPREVA